MRLSFRISSSNTYAVYARLGLLPAILQCLTIRGVKDRWSDLIEQPQKRYAITSEITGRNGIYSRALSRMRAVRKSVMRVDVPHLSLRSLTHLKLPVVIRPTVQNKLAITAEQLLNRWQ